MTVLGCDSFIGPSKLQYPNQAPGVGHSSKSSQFPRESAPAAHRSLAIGRRGVQRPRAVTPQTAEPLRRWRAVTHTQRAGERRGERARRRGYCLLAVVIEEISLLGGDPPGAVNEWMGRQLINEWMGRQGGGAGGGGRPTQKDGTIAYPLLGDQFFDPEEMLLRSSEPNIRFYG